MGAFTFTFIIKPFYVLFILGTFSCFKRFYIHVFILKRWKLLTNHTIRDDTTRHVQVRAFDVVGNFEISM